MKENRNNQASSPTMIICAEREKIEGGGEDAFAFSFRNVSSGYIAVFDGCGGMGARRYPNANNKTGARIASRTAAHITDKMYNDQQFRFDGKDCRRVKKIFTESLNKVRTAVEGETTVMLGGDLFKPFPTTASIAAIKTDETGLLTCEYLWAGDSRGYFLDGDGLCQITKDDLMTEEDAFTNLRSDGRMSNVIHAGGDFRINEVDVTLNSPVIVITSTDGAFGYFSTPMEFEYVILKTLCLSSSSEEWEQRLCDAIIPYTGDDFAICAAVFGFRSFKECKSYYSKRCKYISKNYISCLHENISEQELSALWENYKSSYYRR